MSVAVSFQAGGYEVHQVDQMIVVTTNHYGGTSDPVAAKTYASIPTASRAFNRLQKSEEAVERFVFANRN